MNSIIETKNQVNSISSRIIDGIVIRVFDFDGTLFNSPIPSPNIWDNTMIGKLKGEVHRGGLGWFQNTVTLNDRYIGNSTFNENVVAEVFKSMNDPDSVTVLLTGRNTDFGYQIKRILDARGLVFDHYGFKPVRQGGKLSTFQFKQEFVTELVKEYGADAIEFWDDRYRHVTKFTDLINILGLKGYVHHVNETPCYMNESFEHEVVDILKKDAAMVYERSGTTPIYHGAFLDVDSYNALIAQLGPEIPANWKVFAHHMTICFGKPRTDVVQNYLASHMGDTVTLMATELGVSNDAIAVKISSDVPSDNATPHVTIAVPDGGKPYNSNKITNWIPLDAPIQLNAKINAFYG